MSEIARVSEARQALAEAETPAEARNVEDKARLLAEALAKHDGDLERANEFAELAVEAACKVGALLPPKRPGARTDLEPLRPGEEVGLTAERMSSYRKLAGTDPSVRADYYGEQRAAGDTITKTGLLRAAYGGAHVGHNSGENEWYTPPEYIEAARVVMGGIELDPASCAAANATVQASRYFTAEDDGLSQPWETPALWMNPPYSQPLIGHFIDKLCAEVSAGNVGQAVILVNNATDAKWGQAAIGLANAVCFPAGRIRFIDKDGHPSGAPLQGQMIAHYGDGADGFAEAFSAFGVVLKR